jgi:3-oxoacyl-[acyl-carrier protein] reductase
MDGRVAVVTGAGRGLGAAIADELAARGAAVVVADRSGELARASAERLRATGRVATPLVADVSDPTQVTALFEAAVAEHGRLDVLVNNAGVGAVAPSEELGFDVWSRTLAVNLTGTFLCAQAAARHMLPAGRGVIVNIGSVFATTGMPMRAAYAASKHGVVGLTKVLATEWASRGLRVVAVDPAYVRTALDDADQRAGGYTEADITRRTPMGRYAEPAEVARVVAFLASDAASFVPAARSRSTAAGSPTGAGRRALTRDASRPSAAPPRPSPPPRPACRRPGDRQARPAASRSDRRTAPSPRA